ncbi:hypothetical protein DI487_13985 [Flavobacterium sediminis]|uniref:Uncharacterized protein n=1 Tax=Flavobacterium sediminis TaxID=2201181 RepID=A0A2U8QXH4_9FLAO|nr:hypothetical protein [Flavobacterium sediminis]AWM14853.1 hypothetical protein DI487_13985 [Flavobacterium sediminis]
MKDFDLHNKKIASGFKVPETYFENFESKMMETIDFKAPEKEPKVVSLFHRKQIWISAIAAIFVALLAIPVYFSSNTTENIESQTLENYLTTEYSTYDLIDKLSNEDLQNLETSISLNEDAVEDYLLQEDNLDYYLNE